MINILILPTCNEPGLEVFHSLILCNKLNIYCGSSKPYCKYDPTRILNQKQYIELPLFDNPDFVNFLKKISIKYKIDYIFPTTDELIHRLSREDFGKTKIICSDPKSTNICLSKILTYKTLKRVIPIPKIYSKKNKKQQFPLYGKPDIGAGSKNHIFIEDNESLKLAQKKKLLIMEYLPGEEYTVDCLSDLKGKLIVHNTRIRGNISRGISLGTQNIKNKPISNYIKLISKKIKIKGPWFAQFKLDKKNNPKLLEINARIGGSSTHTRLSGINIPLMSVFMFAGYKIQKPIFNFKQIINSRFLTNTTEIPNLKFKIVIWDFDDTILLNKNKFYEYAIALIVKFNNQNLQQIIVTKNKKIKTIIKEIINIKIFKKIFITNEKINLFKKIINQKNMNDFLFINDSFFENQELIKNFKNIKIITPDRIEMLLNNDFYSTNKKQKYK